eukprot:g41935.t1
MAAGLHLRHSTIQEQEKFQDQEKFSGFFPYFRKIFLIPEISSDIFQVPENFSWYRKKLPGPGNFPDFNA